VYVNRVVLHIIPGRGCPEGESGGVAGPDWGGIRCSEGLGDG